MNQNKYGLTRTERIIFEAMMEKRFMSIQEILSLTPSGKNGIEIKFSFDARVRVMISNINRKIKDTGFMFVNYRWLGYSVESRLFKQKLKEFGLTTAGYFLLELFFAKGKLSHNDIVSFLERKEVRKKIDTDIDHRPLIYASAINKAINPYGLKLENIWGFGYEICSK